MTGSPGEGKGSRKLDCDLYEDCLNYTIKKDWDGFHCEDCTRKADRANGKNASGTSVPEKTKVLCSDCLEKERLGNSPFCASCLGIRGNRAKAVKAKDKGTEKPTKARKAQSKPKGRPKSKKPLSKTDTALRIEFGKHASILREVESLADKEIRPVECQVIYMLKKQLTREEEVQAS